MATSIELATSVQIEIGNLPKKFPFTISIATSSDDNDILVLALKHCTSVAEVCAWEKSIEGGTDAIARIRLGRVTVLARDKGILMGMLTYTPDNPMVWIQAGAADESQPIQDQMGAIFALSIPAHRAMLKLGYTRLETKPIPKDDRMLVFAGQIFGKLGIEPAEHRLSGDQVTVTHWTFSIPIAKALEVFEA